MPTIKSGRGVSSRVAESIREPRLGHCDGPGVAGINASAEIAGVEARGRPRPLKPALFFTSLALVVGFNLSPLRLPGSEVLVAKQLRESGQVAQINHPADPPPNGLAQNSWTGKPQGPSLRSAGPNVP